MAVGRVVRFDESKGYGFIAPEDGGEDVFVHANELVDRGVRIERGTRVQFDLVDGERGLKAFAVRILADQHSRPAEAATPGRPADAEQQGPSKVDDEVFDVFSETEFLQEITELLLVAAPRMSGEDIRHLRGRLLQFGLKHGWVE